MNDNIVFFVSLLMYFLSSYGLHLLSFWIITGSFNLERRSQRFTFWNALFFIVVHTLLIALLLFYFKESYILLVILTIFFGVFVFLVIKPSFFEWVVRFTSLDFNFADYFKQEFEDNDGKNKKSKIIKLFNNSNLIFSVLIFFILCLLSYASNYFELNNYKFWKIITLFIVFRTASRSFEIIYAFSKDTILRNEPTSNLDKFDRIQLAIKSYIEMILINGCLYFLFPIIDLGEKIEIKDCLIKSIGHQTFTNIKITGITTVNYFVYLQVITSLSLVILSFAIYANRDEHELQPTKQSLEKLEKGVGPAQQGSIYKKGSDQHNKALSIKRGRTSSNN